MIHSLIRWCLHNVFIVIVAMVGIVAAGYAAARSIPIDAIPDIGEKQVIVYADWPGRSPQDIDDQVTFPLTTSLAGTPGVKSIRSMSGFGFTMVFAIFDDSVDYYWARSRVLERLNVAQQRLPQNVVPLLGPDATALGQVYWYTVEGEGFDLGELRSIQDWYIRYQLNAVEGVSEVASVGGYVKQYQIDLHPDRMRAHQVTLMDVYEAVRRSNIDVGAKVLEKNGVELFIRGVGFVKSVADLEQVVIRENQGIPLYLSNVATVQLGPDFRRGALDKAGTEAVGGVVVMRYGENPRDVVERLKEKIEQIQPGLPEKRLADGSLSKVRIEPFYDRTTVVEETLDTLARALSEEALLAAVVVLLFLLHVRSTCAVLVTLPLAVAGTFALMYAFGVDANIMSLAGLAIAIGDVADMGIIMTESIYRKVVEMPEGKRRDWNSLFHQVYDGAAEVGGAIVVAVSNTLIAFTPVFFLTDQEGRLFRPLAFTKTFAIGASVVLAITVVPVMCYLLFRPWRSSRKTVLLLGAALGVCSALIVNLLLAPALSGAHVERWATAALVGVLVGVAVARMGQERFLPLDENPVSRFINRHYSRTLRWILAHKRLFMTAPLIILFFGMTIWLGASRTLAPVEWVINLFAYEEMSPALKREMLLPVDEARTRPLVELSQLRWQRVHSEGEEQRRLQWRRQDPAEREAERLQGVRVVSETRIFPGIGREFMPALDEGSLLYMPSLLPHAGLVQGLEVLARQDRAIASVPEVASVVGKLGRTESALDPAPIGMIETVVLLKPEQEWREVPVARWFSGLPGFLRAPLSRLLPETRRITKEEILTELQEKTHVPGVLPSWLQPIQTRLVMLQTGFRAMMGVKIYGSDLHEIEKIGLRIEQLLKQVPGATDVVADRIVGKPYLEIHIDRERAARYGVNVRDAQDVIEMAIGGVNLMETVEGRERYPVRVRLARDYRDSIEEIGHALVPTSSGAQVPLSQLADLKVSLGPQEIKGERGLLVGYVTMNTRDRDEVSVVQEAEQVLRAAIRDGSLVVPPGYYWEWSGQFENQLRATKRMQVLIPLTLAIMFFMLYLGFTRWWVGAIIFFGVLVSASGGFILLGLWGANLSIAVWVGFLVLFGVVDDDGVVMATYLEQHFKDRTFTSIEEIREAVVEAGLRRIRACLMTTATTVFGLMPIFWATGRGADIMQPMAIPSIGGMAISLITLFIVPCLFSAVEERKWLQNGERVS